MPCRMVAFEEGATLAKEHNACFIEISATTEHNLDALFGLIVADFHRHDKPDCCIF